MTTGKVTLSIDLELAWGVWDTVTADELRLIETAERPICTALVDLLDRHQVPASWLVVAALLDEASARARPGAKSCWYAPDVIERIVGAKARHEVGSHGGRHIYFDRISAAQARDDLEFAKSVHRTHGLAFDSFVFPRGAVGHLDILAASGARVVRSRDVGFLRTTNHGGHLAARAANFIDQLLPIPPRPSWPQTLGRLIDIPGSMQVLGRNGLRRFVLPQVTRAKLLIGLKRAAREGGTFHLWFHPSNFYYRRDEQLATLGWFLRHATEEAGRGRIEFRTMGSYAADSGVGSVPERAATT
jgi:peptidoglycan/xylan/chitin deacetylase (PgdA/CDA1 family)